jgi:TIR domain-containing protein
MTRKTVTPRTAMKGTNPVRLFVSYSHLNQPWFGRLSPLLKFKTKPHVAHVWHDHELKAGDHWDKDIQQELEQMDVFVCLLSFEFLASDYIMDVELPRALAREKNGEVEIIPIVLFPMDIHKESPELFAFNPLPAFGKCWSEYEQNGGHYQNAHKPIRDGLWQAIEKVQSR